MQAGRPHPARGFGRAIPRGEGPPARIDRKSPPRVIVPARPAISVVLPVFNGAATLGRAVASLRTQTLTAWELLLVDDGSTDETLGIADALRREDPRVRVLVRRRAGIVAALNAGLSAARGAFIARMDADDVAHPERLAAQAAFLDAPENTAIGLVGCRVEFGGNRATAAGYALHVDWTNGLVTPDEIALNRFVESPFAHPSVMFRRELLERFGGYRDGDFPEDYELWLRWLDAGVRMAKVPQALLTWHDSPDRLSRTAARYDPEAFFRTKAPWIARELMRNEMSRGARPVWVWGAGRPTRKRAAHLGTHGVTVAGYIDVDAKKATPALGGRGVPVVTPENLPAPEHAFVLGYVSSRGARDFIRAALLARGYREGSEFLLCA
jgi:glycosyltransferase involved in cell wall biosynthesis